jgi:hypothetical protein
MSVKKFYVYQHRRADTGEVFYIGKGHGKRLYSKNRNNYWKRIVDKHGLVVEVVKEDLTEDEAFQLEVELIKQYKEQGLSLSNMTDGGEGTVGRITTEASRVNYSKARLGEKNPMFEKSHDLVAREKIRVASVRNHANPEYKEKVREKLKLVVVTEKKKEQIRKALKGVKHTEERRLNQSLAKKGKPSNRKGIVMSEEQKEKIRQALLGRRLSETTKLKVSQASKGRKMSEEAKKKISLANKGRASPLKGKVGTKLTEETKRKLRVQNLGKKLSPETKRKMSEAQKARHASIPKTVSEATRQKIRLKLLGQKLSDETRAKMSASRKRASENHRISQED